MKKVLDHKFIVILLLVTMIFFSLTEFAFSQEEKKIADLSQQLSSETIGAIRSFRERLLADPYRPAFHFCLPEDNGHWADPHDPNSAFFSNGRYHLMYLYNRDGKGFSFGHVSSKDMLHWRYHPDAIGPGDGDEGCFSGGAFIDDNGMAILSYWMLWGAKGIGLAKSIDDEFNKWEKSENNPVIRSDETGITELIDKNGREIHVGSADPSNIWKKDGKYYMLTGSLSVLLKYGMQPDSPKEEQGDRLYLFESDNLKDWKYLHRFYESTREWTGADEDNMCPSFFPLPLSKDGGPPSNKHLLLFISHNRGCQYYIGDYKNDHFFPKNHGRMSWNDRSFFAPEALVDGKGRQIMWAWLNERPDSIIRNAGWTGVYSLPRSLWLGKDGTLRIAPVKELEQLRLNEKIKSKIEIKQDQELQFHHVGSELMEMEVSFLPGNATQYGVKVCVSEDGKEETIIYYDSQEKKLKVDMRNSGLGIGSKIIEEAPLELKKGEPLVLRIFVDKSVVEVFANDKQAITRRIYPTLGGTGISLFSHGDKMKVKRLYVWEMMPSNPY